MNNIQKQLTEAIEFYMGHEPVRPNGKVIIYGSGPLAYKCSVNLELSGVEVSYHIDDNIDFFGNTFTRGKPLYSSDCISHEDILFICVWTPKMSYRLLKQRFNSKGVKKIYPAHYIHLLNRKLSATHYQIGNIDIPDKVELVKNLSYLIKKMDEDSKVIYLNHILWRLSLNDKYLDPPCSDRKHFNLGFLKTNQLNTIIDCGAFCGDGIEDLIYSNNNYKQYIAIEPDKLSYEKLIHYIDKLDKITKEKIIAINALISDKNGTIEICSTGMVGSKINNSENCETRNKINMITIDSLLLNSPVGFIKLDIEGNEKEALDGASETISQFKPVIGVSIYHKPNDFFSLPLNIIKKCDYKNISLRQYDFDGIDLTMYFFN